MSLTDFEIEQQKNRENEFEKSSLQRTFVSDGVTICKQDSEEPEDIDNFIFNPTTPLCQNAFFTLLAGMEDVLKDRADQSFSSSSEQDKNNNGDQAESSDKSEVIFVLFKINM